MASKNPIGYIDIRASVQATEDMDKVQKALLNLISPELKGTLIVERTSLTGHYGNPIILLQARVADKDATMKVFSRIATGLSVLDRELLNEEINLHFEKGNLYLRLDKQAAYQGEYKLQNNDPVHIRVHFKQHDKHEIKEICRELGLLP